MSDLGQRPSGAYQEEESRMAKIDSKLTELVVAVSKAEKAVAKSKSKVTEAETVLAIKKGDYNAAIKTLQAHLDTAEPYK